MKYQRKRIWIDRFQTLLFCRITIYFILYQGAMWLLLYLWGQTSAAFEAVGSFPLLTNNFFRGIVLLVALAPLFALDAIKFTHRIAGPIYRFRKTIKAIADGEEVEPVRLRKGDLLQDLKEDLNEMLKTLEQQGYVILKPGEKAGAEVVAAGAGTSSTSIQSA